MQHTKNQLATQVLSIVVLVMCCMISPTALASAPPIAAVTFSPDGAKVVAVSQRGLQIFSWPQLKRERIVAISFANLHCAAFSPNGQLLAVGGGDPAEDGAAQIFTWPALKPVATLGGHTDSVRSLAWLGNHGVVSASIDREIRVWDLATLAPRAVFRGHSRSVDAICFVEDGKTLVSSGVDQSLRVWDVESGELLRNLSQHTKPVNSLALRPRDEGLPIN